MPIHYTNTAYTIHPACHPLAHPGAYPHIRTHTLHRLLDDEKPPASSPDPVILTKFVGVWGRETAPTMPPLLGTPKIPKILPNPLHHSFRPKNLGGRWGGLSKIKPFLPLMHSEQQK